VVDWIEPELIRAFCPAFADVFVGCEPSQGLEPLCEVVGSQESGEVFAQLIVAVIMIAADSSLFQGAVHALNLAVGPGMLGLCQAMIDVCSGAGQFEGVSPDKLAFGEAFFELLGHRADIAGRCEVGAIVCQHGMNLVGNRRDQRAQEIGSHGPRGFLMEPGEGKF